ncbi:MAG TPA: MraY family glycosyltransferase [Mariprofundaceae bacterium]|nr:MraY family glycosyltransferase [Mariprofundaceae bacterium]
MHMILDHWLSRLLAFLISLLLMFVQVRGHLFVLGFKLFLSSALMTYALLPAVIRLAHMIGALDHPDGDRRIHRESTPRVGGVAVFLATNLTLLLNFDFSLGLKGVCISAIMVALLSLWDDVREIPATVKLLVQLFALFVLMVFGVHAELVSDSWWGALLEVTVTALWMVGVTNAFNFLDGVNGLAASLATAVSLLMGVLAWHTGQTYMLLLTLSVAGAAFGFLPDNARYTRPARIFLGDVGSTYLGWMMAGIALMGGWSSEGPVRAYAAPVLIFSVMIFDMVYTTISRIRRGDVKSLRQWVAYVGRDHLHHRLMHLGLSPLQAVVAIVALTLISGLGALALVTNTSLYVWLLLLQAVVIYSLLSLVMVMSQKGDAARRG